MRVLRIREARRAATTRFYLVNPSDCAETRQGHPSSSHGFPQMWTAQRSGTMIPMSEHHHPLTPTQLLSYMRAQPWAIEATVTPVGTPQAAVLGVAITDRWELLFDTVTQSRKHQNLLKNPRVAFVIGWEHERTVQYEGIAEMPTEAQLPDVQAHYFDRFPDGPTRQTWPGLVYWRVRPTWIRYSNFNLNPPIIQEWDAAEIAACLK